VTPPLSTARLALRGFEANDLELLHRLYGNAEVMHFLGDGQPLDRAETQEKLTSVLYRSTYLGIPMWALFRRFDGDFIGRCGFSPWGDGDEIELAYTLIPDAWGAGYAVEAGHACLEFIVEHGRWRYVLARTRPTNARSRRVLEKLGFTLEREGEDSGGSALFFRIECR